VPEPPPALVSSNLRAKQEKALKPLASKFSVSKIATVGKNSTTGNSPALANALAFDPRSGKLNSGRHLANPVRLAGFLS
jgi:hypothetical protein